MSRRPMILVPRNIKYMRIFAGVPLERGCHPSSTISANFEHEFCRCTAWHIYTKHMSLRAASHTVIGYVENQHSINVLNAFCLASFRIKSAQSNGRRHKQN